MCWCQFQSPVSPRVRCTGADPRKTTSLSLSGQICVPGAPHAADLQGTGGDTLVPPPTGPGLLPDIPSSLPVPPTDEPYGQIRSRTSLRVGSQWPASRGTSGRCPLRFHISTCETNVPLNMTTKVTSHSRQTKSQDIKLTEISRQYERQEQSRA